MRATRLARLWHVVPAVTAAILCTTTLSSGQINWPERVRQLADPDPAVVKEARTLMQATLTDINFSVAERSAASDQAVGELRKLVDGGGEPAVQALIVAGDVATEASLDILDAARASSSLDVRYAAVLGFAQTFERLNTSAPAINAAKARWMISRLEEGLSSESNADVADRYVRALIRAAGIAQPSLGDLRIPAHSAMASAIGRRLNTLARTPEDDRFLTPVVRAVEVVRDALVADALKGNLPPDFVCKAAGLAGDVLAYVYNRLRAGENGGWVPVLPTDDPEAADARRVARRPAVTLAQLADTTLILAKDRFQIGVPGVPFGFAQMLEPATPAGDRGFLEPGASGALSVVGDGGLLSKFPCGFGANRFLKPGP